MIPECDVTPMIDVDYASLRTLTAYQVVEGFAVVRDYQPLIDVGWDDARECAEAEARWLDRAAKAPTAEEFDQILAGAAQEEAPDDFDWLFRGLDVGVAGLSLVLSAARYATCFSCRTHPSRAGDHMPQVTMAAEPQRVRVLIGYAERAGCGVDSMEGGLVYVYAACVRHLHALAQSPLAPSWRSFPRLRGFRGCRSTSPAMTPMSSNGPTTRSGDAVPEVDLGRALHTTIVTWAAGPENRNRGRS